jgi:hypothetical protein
VSNKIRFALHRDTYKRRTATGPFAHCIVARSATISIFADLPQPSELITDTTSGGIMRSLLPFAGPLQTCSTPLCP